MTVNAAAYITLASLERFVIRLKDCCLMRNIVQHFASEIGEESFEDCFKERGSHRLVWW